MYQDVIDFRSALKDNDIDRAQSCIDSFDRLDFQGALQAAAVHDSPDLVDEIVEHLVDMGNDRFRERAVEEAWVAGFKNNAYDALKALVEQGYQPPTYGSDIDDDFEYFVKNDRDELVREAFPIDNLPEPNRSVHRSRSLKPLRRHDKAELIEYYLRVCFEEDPVQAADYASAFLKMLLDVDFDRVRSLYDEFGDRHRSAWVNLFNAAVRNDHEEAVQFFMQETDLTIQELNEDALSGIHSNDRLAKAYLDRVDVFTNSSILKAFVGPKSTIRDDLKQRAIEQFEGALFKDDLPWLMTDALTHEHRATLFEYYDPEPLSHRTLDVEDVTVRQAIFLIRHNVVSNPGRLIQNEFELSDETVVETFIDELSDYPDALSSVLSSTNKEELLKGAIEQLDLTQTTTVNDKEVTLAGVILMQAHSMDAPSIIEALREVSDVGFSDVPEEELLDDRTYPALYEQAREMGDDEHNYYCELFGDEPVSEAIKGQNPNYRRARKFIRAGAPVPDDENLFRKAIEDGEDELVDVFSEQSLDVNAELFYAATLRGEDSVFKAIARQYTPKNTTALRAANRILTGNVPIVRLGRLDWLEKLNDDFEIDWNGQPQGSGELGMRPLRTLAGFSGRTGRSGQSLSDRRDELPERIVAEALIERGADPGAGQPGETALGEALRTDNTELFQWFIDDSPADVDLSQHPYLINECIEKKYIDRLTMLFDSGMEGPVEADVHPATVIGQQIDMRIEPFKTILQTLHENNVQLANDPGRSALNEAFEAIPGNDQRERAVQNLETLLQYQVKQGGVPSIPQETIKSLKRHEDITDLLGDYLRGRQLKQLRAQGLIIDKQT